MSDLEKLREYESRYEAEIATMKVLKRYGPELDLTALLLSQCKKQIAELTLVKLNQHENHE